MGTTIRANPDRSTGTGVSLNSVTPASEFVQNIQNSDSLQLIGVIANCSGIISSTLAFISFIQSLTEPNDSQILSAIEQLQETLNAAFTALGNLIQQQTQIIVDTVNRDGMALALANSDALQSRRFRTSSVTTTATRWTPLRQPPSLASPSSTSLT